MEANVFLVLALSSLMALGDPAPRPVIGEFELPAIAGTWQIELEGGLEGCRERYNFGRDGALTTTSGEERTVGDYRFSYIDEVALPVLAVRTEWDNNKPDCLGNQVDQSGHSFANFVRLDSRHDPKYMQWCEDAEGAVCNQRLWRVLP